MKNKLASLSLLAFFLILEIEVIFKYFTHAFNYSVKKKRNNERKFCDYFIKGKC